MFEIGDILTTIKNSEGNIKLGEKFIISAYKNSADGVYMISLNRERMYVFYTDPNSKYYIWDFFDINEKRTNKIKKIKERIYETR